MNRVTISKAFALLLIINGAFLAVDAYKSKKRKRSKRTRKNQVSDRYVSSWRSGKAGKYRKYCGSKKNKYPCSSDFTGEENEIVSSRNGESPPDYLSEIDPTMDPTIAPSLSPNDSFYFVKAPTLQQSFPVQNSISSSTELNAASQKPNQSPMLSSSSSTSSQKSFSFQVTANHRRPTVPQTTLSAKTSNQPVQSSMYINGPHSAHQNSNIFSHHKTQENNVELSASTSEPDPLSSKIIQVSNPANNGVQNHPTSQFPGSGEIVANEEHHVSTEPEVNTSNEGQSTENLPSYLPNEDQQTTNDPNSSLTGPEESSLNRSQQTENQETSPQLDSETSKSPTISTFNANQQMATRSPSNINSPNSLPLPTSYPKTEKPLENQQILNNPDYTFSIDHAMSAPNGSQKNPNQPGHDTNTFDEDLRYPGRLPSPLLPNENQNIARQPIFPTGVSPTTPLVTNRTPRPSTVRLSSPAPFNNIAPSMTYRPNLSTQQGMQNSAIPTLMATASPYTAGTNTIQEAAKISNTAPSLPIDEKMPNLKSNPACKMNSDGFFGNMTEDSIVLLFAYEVEIEPTVELNNVLPQLEISFVNKILPTVSHRCESSDDRPNRRRRRMEVEGVSPVPDDVVTDVSCFSLVNEANKCFLILGEITLYVSGNKEVEIEAVRQVLKQGMVDGEFNNPALGISQVTYVVIDALAAAQADPETKKSETKIEEEKGEYVAYSLIFSMAGALAVLVCALLYRRQTKQNDYRNNDGPTIIAENSEVQPAVDDSMIDESMFVESTGDNPIEGLTTEKD